MNEKIIENLKAQASMRCWDDGLDDETIIDDYAGGNIDDAYAGGVTSGETLLARSILTELGIAFTIED